MSADNGIYIVKFPDGFRVIHAQGIDNIDYFPKGSEDRKQELKNYFKDAKLFINSDNAHKYARQLYYDMLDEAEIVEYGICDLGEYEHWDDKYNE